MRNMHRDVASRQRYTEQSHSSLTVRVVLVLAMALWRPVWAQTIPCEDVLFLVEQSRNGFLSIQADTKNESGGFETTENLPGAHDCNVIEDVEKRTYRCTWKYAISDDTAEAEYEEIAENIVNCLGSSASVIEDQPVNHPDTYKSYIYRLSDTEVRVTLKDKRELMSTFVSVAVDGQQLSRLNDK